MSVFDNNVFDSEMADVKPANRFQLFFSSIQFISLEDGVKPNFHCPHCRSAVWQPKCTLGTSFPDPFDFNQKISFPIPMHNDPSTGQPCILQSYRIELFVAVHKDANGTALCIQKSSEEGAGGIPANWWMRPT